MVCKEIGNYKVFEVEKTDIVVVLGEVGGQRDFLVAYGFEENPQTKEWVGDGGCLYRMTPEDFYDRFGAEGGTLQAQVTDGSRICVVDSLPEVEEDDRGRSVIVKIRSLELDTHQVINQVMSRMLERG